MSETDQKAVFDEIMDIVTQEKRARAELMPTERRALEIMFDAYQRLTELGFSDIIYCPKDGEIFECIEAGSTGIHHCHYDGEWPSGSWWVHSDGDLWPAHPILYRRIPRGETPAQT